MKKRVKIAVDILMLVLFIYMFSYQPGMGLLQHAMLGISLFTLFIIHNLLNFQWYKVMFKGKYTARRGTLAGINILLLLLMLLMMASSLMISGMVFSISFLPVRYYWRNIHAACSGWMFLLMAVHLGFHTQGAIRKLKNKLNKYIWYLLQVLISMYGVYSFLQLGLLRVVFMLPKSVPFFSKTLFFVESLSVIFTICLVVYYWTIIVGRFQKRK